MRVDLDKAALQGVSAAEVTRTVQIGLSGASAGLLHDPASREDVPIEVRLSRPDRSGIEDLENLKLPGPSGAQGFPSRGYQHTGDRDRSKHLSQAFAARRLCYRGRCRNRGKSCVRDRSDERVNQ